MQQIPEPEHEFSTRVGMVTLRPEQPADELFLFEAYASTREEELNLTGWDAATRNSFLNHQFKAMRQGYAAMFPEAAFSIILLEGQPIGRQVLDQNEERICVVDVVLLPPFQEKGIGSVLMESVLRLASRANLPVRLHVVRENRALNLYRRLGFQPLGEVDVYQEMEWRPAPNKQG